MSRTTGSNGHNTGSFAAGAGLGAGLNVTQALPGAARTIGGSGKSAHPATEVDEDLAEALNEEESAEGKTKKGRKNRWIIALSVSVMLVGTAALILWWMAQGGNTRARQVDVNVRAGNGSGAQPSASAPSDAQLTAAAIESLRQSAAAAQPSTGAAAVGAAAVGTAPGAAAMTGGQAATVPVVVTPGVAATVGREDASARNTPTEGARSPATAQTSAPVNAAQESQRTPQSQANNQHSIVFGELLESNSPERRGGRGSTPAEGLAYPASAVPSSSATTARRALAAAPARPPFGTMIPLRTLGAVYTLRPGALVRFAVTRDISGPGWQIRRNTIFVGTVRGGEFDRAFVALIGFIDPASGRLVRSGGDLLGADGASGLQGTRRRMHSRWARALGQAADSALSLAQAALAGRNGTTIVLPSVNQTLEPELGTLRSARSAREFVEVQAGKSCYVMMTDLPREIEGVDALEQMDGDSLVRALEASATTETGLSESELAALLESGSPAQIRSALPRMTPPMRRLAAQMLQQTDER